MGIELGGLQGRGGVLLLKGYRRDLPEGRATPIDTYAGLGFDRLADEAFGAVALARIIEP